MVVPQVFSDSQVKFLCSNLRQSTLECASRGLVFAAKWSAELLASLNENYPGEILHEESQKLNPSEVKEFDKIILAKAYFDLREFDQANFCLAGCTSPKAIFIRCYSKYLAGERRKEDKLLEVKGSSAENNTEMNQELSSLYSELNELYSTNSLDGFCLYIYALVLEGMQLNQKSIAILVESLSMSPFNWSAWKNLYLLCENETPVEKLFEENISKHFQENTAASSCLNPVAIMYDFFLASLELERQNNCQALEKIRNLRNLFPSSVFMQSQEALAHYNLRNFDEAETLFLDIQRKQPFRIDQMDIFSNILYVKDSKMKLSHLARSTTHIDKYRPETCCIIGNYFSLRGDHEKAVLYFKRALKLNRKYLCAWTLIGHEYIELKNTPSAIEAYRKATEINARDYRAWYGLGQTYEILRMPTYSTYYYKKAVMLR
eukprot:Sdes_comp19296_c0_seq3m10362